MNAPVSGHLSPFFPPEAVKYIHNAVGEQLWGLVDNVHVTPSHSPIVDPPPTHHSTTVPTGNL